jgi:glycogen(starch) synthase
LKLTYYTHDWAPLVGGIQTVYTALAEGVSGWSKTHAGENIEVTLVTQTPAEGMDDSRLPFAVLRRPSLRRLTAQIRTADVLHVAGPAILPLAIGWILRKPTVIEHHGYQSICPNGLLIYGPDRSICPGHFMAARYSNCVRCNSGTEGWVKSLRGVILTFVRRWLCQQARSNIAVSYHVAERIKLPRTRTIYHGIADSGPAPRNETYTVNLPLQIGYVGRLVSEKGLPLLLEAAKRLEDGNFPFHLTIVGDGPDRRELEVMTQRLGLQARTTFLGELTGPGLEDAVRSLQVVVMPSRWEETAGLAAIEQMMRGGVVIATDIGGLSEVVGDAGLKFSAGDSGALYSCLRQVLEDPSLGASLGSAARARAVKVFNRDNMIQEHVSLYQEALLR